VGQDAAVRVGFVDELDGMPTGRLLVDGDYVGAWAFCQGELVDPDAPRGNEDQPGNFRTLDLVQRVALETDSTLTLEADPDGGSMARIDWVELAWLPPVEDAFIA
jgi:hypothetical protein